LVSQNKGGAPPWSKLRTWSWRRACFCTGMSTTLSIYCTWGISTTFSTFDTIGTFTCEIESQFQRVKVELSEKWHVTSRDVHDPLEPGILMPTRLRKRSVKSQLQKITCTRWWCAIIFTIYIYIVVDIYTAGPFACPNLTVLLQIYHGCCPPVWWLEFAWPHRQTPPVPCRSGWMEGSTKLPDVNSKISDLPRHPPEILWNQPWFRPNTTPSCTCGTSTERWTFSTIGTWTWRKSSMELSSNGSSSLQQTHLWIYKKRSPQNGWFGTSSRWPHILNVVFWSHCHIWLRCRDDPNQLLAKLVQNTSSNTAFC